MANHFASTSTFGGESYFGAGNTYGESAANPVIQHQISSSKNPTSGISTTPHVENARIYATWQHSSGFVFKIDTELLGKYGVSAFPVAEYALAPTIPGDEEIILVANDFGALPTEIVVEVFEVRASHA